MNLRAGSHLTLFDFNSPILCATVRKSKIIIRRHFQCDSIYAKTINRFEFYTQFIEKLLHKKDLFIRLCAESTV